MPNALSVPAPLRIAALLLLLLFGATPPLWAQAAASPKSEPLRLQTTLPVEVLEQGHLLVKLRVNETEEATFLLDTGVNYSMLTEELARRHKLTSKQVPDIDGRTREINGKPMRSVVFPLLRAGTFRYINFEWLAVPQKDLAFFPRPIDGILGANAFRKFGLYIDWQSKRITLFSPLPLTPEDLRLVNMEAFAPMPIKQDATNGLYFLQAHLASEGETHIAQMMIDTGGSRTFLSRRAAQALKLKAAAEKQSYQTFYGAQSVQAHTLPQMSLSEARGGVRIAGLPVLVWEKEGENAFPLLGLDVLAKGRVLLDFAGEKMYFAPPAAPAKDGKTP